MRTTLITVFAGLLASHALAQEGDSGISYSSESASEFYLACGNDYVAALDSEGIAEYGRSLGYQVNPETVVVTAEKLSFQLLATGTDRDTRWQVPLTAPVSRLAETATKGQLFAVFYPIQGQQNLAVIDFHAPVNGTCQRILGPYKLKGAELYPSLVQNMINEEWNQ